MNGEHAHRAPLSRDGEVLEREVTGDVNPSAHRWRSVHRVAAALEQVTCKDCDGLLERGNRFIALAELAS